MEEGNKPLKKMLYTFILGLCFAILYSYILRPVYLRVKYQETAKKVLKQKYGEYKAGENDKTGSI